MTFDLNFVEVTCVTLPLRIIVCKSHENTSTYVDTVNLFSKGHWPVDDLWPMSIEVTSVTLPKDHCVQVLWEYINVCGYSDQFWNIRFNPYLQKLQPKVIDHYMMFDPKPVEVTCVTLPKDHCNQVSWKYIKVCGYCDFFLQKLEPKVTDP